MFDSRQMTVRENMKRWPAVRHRDGRREPDEIMLIEEEPFMIRVDERPYSVVMRTPGEEIFHAAGFCLGEGIIDSRDDIEAIGLCELLEQNVVDVVLTPERRDLIPDILERRGFISRTSCGICGKEMIEELFQQVRPVGDCKDFEVGVDDVNRCVELLSEHQRCYQVTRGSHAALVLDGELNTIAFSEDVGRHNALDKSIGRALMSGKLNDARILVLASRVSHELVQKAARAGIPTIVSYSRPTSMGARMAGELNMTLAFPDDKDGSVVVVGEGKWLADYG